MTYLLQRDQQIKEKREIVTLPKDYLKQKHVEISEIGNQLPTVHTAVTLGREVEKTWC
jgi:ethanolamine utilization cobalamin adenosyltransferase